MVNRIATYGLDLTNVQDLPVCPKCGRHGEMLLRVDGSATVTHKRQMVAIVGIVQRPLEWCDIESTQQPIEARGRVWWLALLNDKNGKSDAQRRRNFEKACGIEASALIALLIERGLEWDAEKLDWYDVSGKRNVAEPETI